MFQSFAYRFRPNPFAMDLGQSYHSANFSGDTPIKEACAVALPMLINQGGDVVLQELN